jgi:hypothetical protein
LSGAYIDYVRHPPSIIVYLGILIAENQVDLLHWSYSFGMLKTGDVNVTNVTLCNLFIIRALQRKSDVCEKKVFPQVQINEQPNNKEQHHGIWN